jgi:Bacterial Ig-like domain (group 1)
VDPYTGQGVPGVTVKFNDGGKGGTFGNPTPVTDANGNASTSYTFSTTAQTVTIWASNPGVKSISFTETSTHAAEKWVLLVSGGNQTTPVTTSLPQPFVTKISDQYGNGIPGVNVAFSDGGAGGSFSATTVTTNSFGKASTNYTASTKAAQITISASSAGLSVLKIHENIVAGPVKGVAVVSGNNQTAAAGSTLAQQLTVRVTDQYGNLVSGASVSFSDGGAGGSFSANPVTTSSTGQASSSYTTPATPGTVTITATVGSVTAGFTETAQ